MKKEKIQGTGTLPVTRKRLLVIATALVLFLCYLFGNLFRIGVLMHEYYKQKVYDEITTTSALRAKRGNIYDTNMNLLATTETTWRIFLSTREIRRKMKADGVAYDTVIADGLSSLFGTDRDELLGKIRNTGVLDVTVKKSVKEEEYKKVLDFIEKNNLSGLVCTEAQSHRYYPYETMFAHVLGFTGSDNQGLYGIEYTYNEQLSGKDGRYLYAKDANGRVMPNEYESYIEAEDGHSLVTTLDAYVQEVLEGELEKIRVNHMVNNRVTGIVMDVSTGAILAMATSSPFNPNDPYTLDSVSEEKLNACGYEPGSDEYKAKKRELMEIMWSNKAVSETYEPGSTFKVVTVSTALELGVANVNDRFSCVGYYNVGGWRIRCHKAGGHGHGFTLAYGLQMSCNPTMMQLAERIGAENFYRYVEKFGYLKKTGIDLPSEASTIFHKPENIGSTELATASFGQRFKVTVIGQLTAIAAVANGGMSVTPHVVDKIIDKDGNTVFSFSSGQKSTRIISENVAKTVSAILEEGVSGNGGAKNAHVDGYKVAAKTGTSQKFDILDANGNSYLRIGSTVAYAPSDESGVAVIIVVDEPTSQVKYGSTVAAPYVSDLLGKVLPYLGYRKNAESEEVTLPSYVGMNIRTAEKKLTDTGITYRVIGDGDVVLSQFPAGGETVTTALSEVLLYTTDIPPDTVKMPSLVGMEAAEANHILTDLGLSVRLVGVSASALDHAVKVTAQSAEAGTECRVGDVITLTVLTEEYEE